MNRSLHKLKGHDNNFGLYNYDMSNLALIIRHFLKFLRYVKPMCAE